jgi:hypothetical protein
MYVKLAWPFTPERRQQAMHDAVEDHRRQCAKAPPEAKRVYRIDYPRA